jgi:hypothetical protein
VRVIGGLNVYLKCIVEQIWEKGFHASEMGGSNIYIK